MHNRLISLSLSVACLVEPLSGLAQTGDTLPNGDPIGTMRYTYAEPGSSGELKFQLLGNRQARFSVNTVTDESLRICEIESKVATGGLQISRGAIQMAVAAN